MDKIAGYIVLALLAICKLLITGICLAIGFRIGAHIVAAGERRIAKRAVKSDNIEQAVA